MAKPVGMPPNAGSRLKLRLRITMRSGVHTLYELKHERRAFSPAVNPVFENLFGEVDDLKAWIDGNLEPVVYELPAGTEVYRARVCNNPKFIPFASRADSNNFP
jgi:hypothetical protein